MGNVLRAIHAASEKMGKESRVRPAEEIDQEVPGYLGSRDGGFI